MTCRVAARDGMRIETQNVVGSRETDLLRVADWFFPQGMNHHELLAGVPGLQRVMQSFARRVAGLGRLPDPSTTAAPLRAAVRREVDVLVVGCGAAGMAAALELLKRGRTVEIVDDALEWGGSLRALVGEVARPWAALLEGFAEKLRSAPRLIARTRTTAAGIYGDDVLVVSNEATEVITARTLVLAPGAHDGVLAFEGNDVPGVMSARAAGWLLAGGVVPGRKVAIARVDRAGPFGEAFARAAPAGTACVLLEGRPVRARGNTRVREVTVETGGSTRSVACDALLVDAPRAPAYELCEQAGARLTHGGADARGFGVTTLPGGLIRAGTSGATGVFALGEVTGTPLEPRAIARSAAELADACST
jgi:sarcosine oxidase subunit alpha